MPVKRVDLVTLTETLQRAMMGDPGATRELLHHDVPLSLAYIRQLEQIEQIASEFKDDDPCRYDHNGYCQAHYSSRPCQQARLRNALTALESRPQ